MKNLQSKTYLFSILSICASVGAVVAQVSRSQQAEEQRRQEAINEVRKAEKQLGRPPASQILVADDDPGSSGLQLDGISVGKSSDSLLDSDVLSQFASNAVYSRVVASKSRYFSSEITLISYDSPEAQRRTTYSFSSIGEHDPGYVADPQYLRSSNKLLFKFGRFGEMGSYYIYAFDLLSKKLIKVTSAAVQNTYAIPSYDGQRVAYADNGGTTGLDAPKPLKLIIYNFNETKSLVVASGSSLEETYSWLPNGDLSFSLLKERVYDGVKVKYPVSYLYDPVKGKSQVWLTNCYSPRESRDGRYVVFKAAVNPKANYSNNNAALFVKNLATKKITRLQTGSDSFFSRYAWSGDSVRLFVIGSMKNSLSLLAYAPEEQKSLKRISVSLRNQHVSDVYAFGSGAIVEIITGGGKENPLTGEVDSVYNLISIDPVEGKSSSVLTCTGIEGLHLSIR